MDRHFAGNSADSIRAIARTAYDKRKVAALRDAIFELSHFRTTSEARRLLQELGPLLGEIERQTTTPHDGDDGLQPPAWPSNTPRPSWGSSSARGSCLQRSASRTSPTRRFDGSSKPSSFRRPPGRSWAQRSVAPWEDPAVPSWERWSAQAWVCWQVASQSSSRLSNSKAARGLSSR
jgi:hypothetical protein